MWLLFFLLTFSITALLLGLIKPNIVIRWGTKRDRKMVLGVYGTVVIIIILLMIKLAPTSDINVLKQSSNSTTKSIQTPKEISDEKKQEAEGYYDEAKELWVNSKYDEGITLIDKALDIDPDNAEYLRLKAGIADGMNDNKTTIELMQRL